MHPPLHRKAYLNHRYHARRGMYLAAVAAHLRSTKAFHGRPLRLESCQQDPARPVLVLGLPPAPSTSTSPPTARAQTSASHGFELRLLPCLPPSTFTLAKLGPDRNCVRAVQQARPAPGAAIAPSRQQQQQQQEEAALLPTPAYNASVVADCCVLAHAALLRRMLRSNPKIADGLLLLKVCACSVGASA